MKMRISLFLAALFFLAAFTVIGCDNSDSSDTQAASTTENLKDTAQLPQNYYYDDEIFPDELAGIYGDWIPYSACSGDMAVVCTDLTIEENKPDYDFLRIERNGKFKLFKENVLLMYGKIYLYRTSYNEALATYSILFSPDSSLGCDTSPVTEEEVCPQVNGVTTPHISFENISIADNSLIFKAAVIYDMCYRRAE